MKKLDLGSKGITKVVRIEKDKDNAITFGNGTDNKTPTTIIKS